MKTLTALTQKRRLQSDYTKLEETRGRLHKELNTTHLPKERAVILELLAGIDEELAVLHSAAFGYDPIMSEGGRDMAESLASSAVLYRSLASTERGQTPFAQAGVSVDETALWGELAGTINHRARAGMIRLIHKDAAERVGALAAEVLGMVADSEIYAACEAEGHPRRFRRVSFVPPRWER